MYKSEAAFSKALCDKLKAHCPLIQRIESGETGRGIPDIFLVYKKQGIWIELKNDRSQYISGQMYEIKWRRGQQSWALKYYKATGKCTYTVVALNNGFLIIPMNQRYRDNIVMAHDCYRGTVLADIIEAISIEQSKINL